MNKSILFPALLLITASVNAQEPVDALRSSWYTQGGTARVQAIGGANGSLGGDITATFVNPAGLGFYKTGDFVFTPAYRFGKTKASYLDRTEQEKGKRFTWGTTGFVFGTGANTGRHVRSSAFSLAYNRTADFNSNILYRGLNRNSSYSQKYLEEIRRNNVKDGNVLANDYPLGAGLAFNTFWIDTVGGGTNGNFNFQSRSANILAANGLLQQDSIVTHGGIDELAFGLGVNLKDKLFLGGTLGVPFLHYKRNEVFIEADPTSNVNGFDFALVDDILKTTGVGFNLKLGAIYKPHESWRLGLAFHTPTVYTITEKHEVSVTTNTDEATAQSDFSKDYTNDLPSETKYSYISPYRVIGSVSYVLREIQDVTKQRGFLTADVEYINYKASSFSTADDPQVAPDQGYKDYLKLLNKAIDNAYKGAFNFRVGGELKFTTVMVRLGAAWYGNPYKNIRGEKGNRVNLSGGLGYRNKGFFVDLTYVQMLNKDVHFAYRLATAPYSGANLKNTMGNVLLTFGVKI